MTNVRVGGKTYVSVETLSFEELQAIAMAISKEATGLQKAMKNPSNMRLIMNQIELLDKRQQLIARLMEKKQPPAKKE